MGKSSKKSNAKVAVAAPVPAVKPTKKGKRDAEEALEKLASAKKQKKEVAAVVTKQKDQKKKLPPPKKEVESSSSEEDTSSESEEEVSASVNAVKPITKTAKKERSSDEDEDSSEDEPPKTQKSVASKATPKPNVEESSEDSSDESDEESQNKKLKVQASVSSNADKSNKMATQENISSDEEDGSEENSEDSSEGSEDEQPIKTPKKNTDVKMKDAPSGNTSDKQEPKTPSQNQSSGSKTLFVGNLSYDVGRDEVSEFFEEAGEVVGVRLATSEDGSFRGFGHVEFATEAAAQKAIEMNGQMLLERPVKLDFARERGAYTPQTGKDNNSNQKGGQSQGQTIFVKGFDKSVGEDEIRSSLQDHFGSCGQISRVSVPQDFETGASKGIAYIDFKDQDGVSQALELNGSDLGGYSLTVDEAKPRGESRGGGWSGGRGSSGRGDRGRGGRFGGRRGGRDGGRGGRDGGRGGRGRGSRGGRGTPKFFGSAGKKTTFGDD